VSHTPTVVEIGLLIQIMICDVLAPVGSLEIGKGVTCKLFVEANAAEAKLLKEVGITDRNNTSGERGPTAYYGSIAAGRGKSYVLYASIPSKALKLRLRENPPKTNWHKPSNLRIQMRPLLVNSVWDMKPKQSPVGGAANIFGSYGVVHVNSHDFISVPFYNALDVAYALKAWGIVLTPLGYGLPSHKQNVIMAAYNYSRSFVKGWVHHNKNGPGVFLESHKFEHTMTPVTRYSFGPVVAGIVKEKHGEVDGKSRRDMLLVGLIVPFGYSITLPGHVLHSDWYLRGKWATTLAKDDDVETAYLRGPGNEAVGYKFTMSMLD
jgi:hypothetical protein